jgi:phosphoglycolate phosphatase-like HAD superfamily hydrolase
VNESLAIFDIDGTLCDTGDVDGECFCAVATELLQVPLGPSSWEGAPHITDAGIVDWLWHRHRSRAPTEIELETFVQKFEAALARQLERTPGRFAAMPGAAPLLELLRGQEWDVAIATGGWARTARLKLRAAGLPVELLLASSDDSHDRAAIFELARCRAQAMRPGAHQRVVLVGDGIWDFRVATHLGWPFLGIGCGECGARLRHGGASAVADNFLDGSGVLHLLRSCAVP